MVLDVPLRSEIVPYAMAMAHRRGLPLDFMRLTLEDATAQNGAVDGVFRELERRHMATVVDPKPDLCPGGDCRLLSDDGWPLYNDSNHLSSHGALLLTSRLARCILGNRP